MKVLIFQRCFFSQTRIALIHILSDLAEEDHFGLITFDSQVFHWKRELVQATKGNLESAKTFARQIVERGCEISSILWREGRRWTVEWWQWQVFFSFQPPTLAEPYWREHVCWMHIPEKVQRLSSYFSRMETLPQVTINHTHTHNTLWAKSFCQTHKGLNVKTYPNGGMTENKPMVEVNSPF